MDKLEIIERLKNIAGHAIHHYGEEPFVMSLDDGIAVHEAIELFEKPIQPKRGKWILDRSGAYCCSECMEPCASYVMMKPRDKFCKMCGADMRGEQNATD